MRVLYFLFATLVVGCLASHGFAVDLKKVDRTIRKEPAYGDKPRYALLVLGPKADTRIWLVIDGKTLHVDRNGNGDLTEKGEQVPVKNTEGHLLQFEAGPIVEADGKTEHSVLTVYQYFHGQFGRLVNGVIVGDVRGTPGQGTSGEAGCTFAEKARDAPIIHINGPLTMRVYGAVVSSRKMSRLAKYPFQLGAGEWVSELHVQVGTEGFGKGTFAAIAVEQKFPANIHPVVKLVVPSKTNPGETIQAEFSLKERC